MDNFQSRPYGEAKAACEYCVLGRGVHADWCELKKVAASLVEQLGQCVSMGERRRLEHFIKQKESNEQGI